MQNLKVLSCLLFLFLTLKVNAQTDITLIDIDKIGHRNLEQIKDSKKVDWWVEMGDKLIVSLNEHSNELPSFVRIIATQKNVDLSQVAFESSGHCSHEGGEEKLHQEFTEIFSSKSFKVISTHGVMNQVDLFTHKKIIPFKKNTVLAYQINNRPENKEMKIESDIQALVSQVDKNRWLSGVEYLANLDRMEDADLIIAGEWLEGQFQNLGLTTSRLDLDRYAGFNVLGFKEGTTRPDEWYVVGAHLDSRNQTWDESLPSPGAEDNASGCSGVLEMANIFSQYNTESSILFICFNEEERGLYGSRAVVDYLTAEGNIDKVQRMMNMDMISYRLGNANTAIAGVSINSYADFAENLANNGRMYTDLDWEVVLNACCTDFVSFNSIAPSLTSHQPNISTYFGYHNFNDLPENLDPSIAAGIIKANVATLADYVGVSVKSNHSIKPAHSGMWYNPEQSGHGATIEVLSDDLMLVVWYVFDSEGNQIWLVGAGNYEDDTATIEVSILENGRFPPDFVVDDVIIDIWGTLKFKFLDCNTLDFSWEPTEDSGYEAGNMQFKRLTGIAGLTCE